ncbi:hypothetical protein MPSEU_000437900 [Mayamaea pseudoterrestris]|nr:hypothetical protein MPSEU_000437900 [Mayamaea pseudoterrestris]
MSGFAASLSGYGEDSELQRQFDEYQRGNPGISMGMPPGPPLPDYYHQQQHHHLSRVPSGASGSSPPTHSTPYVPQNYGPPMGHTSSPTMSSSPLMMAQGMPPYATHHQPPTMLAYANMQPNYSPSHMHYQVAAPPGVVVSNYSYPPPPMPPGGSPITEEDLIDRQNIDSPEGIAALYSQPEPLTHPRAPKATTTMEQIQIMQEAFKREQDSSRRRHQSAYAEAAARRAVRMGNKPEYGGGGNSMGSLQSSASASPTSSAGSLQSSGAAGQYGFGAATLSSQHPPQAATTTTNSVNDPKARLPTIVTKRRDAAVLDQDEHGRMIVRYTDSDAVFYIGSAPLGVEDDKYWLSELQVYLRSNFAEAFSASEDDIAVLMHGRNKPISLGQIGIRCRWCKHDSPAERGQQATSYPSLISGIYNSVQQMLRLHLDSCLSMPHDVRDKIEYLKLSCSSRGGRKQYWIDSARRIGLTDTPTGIHFVRDPDEPLPPLSGPSVAARDATALRKKRPPVASYTTNNVPRLKTAPSKARPFIQDENYEDEYSGRIMDINMPSQPPKDAAPLVFPEDKPLISDYLYLTMEQMALCNLMEADRVGCYKTRKVGFPGIACRHCVGQAGCGRYFPASEASLSQTTTSQTILNHVRNCRRCPAHIRDELEIMKRERTGPDGKRHEKPKHGGRKVFFHRLWCRIQGLDIDDEEEGEGSCEDEPEPRSSMKKGRRKNDEDYSFDELSCNVETSHSDSIDYGLSSEKAKGKRSSPRSTRNSSSASKASSTDTESWVHGCVRLTKADDSHWLSEMECFARTELVEVFSYTRDDSLQGYSGRKLPSEGQVGVRCVYCKDLDPNQRMNGCVIFPDSLESLHSKVADMIRLHFPSCGSLPDNVRQTFKSLRGFDAKVSTEDSHHYWIDAAVDIGLSGESTGGTGTWGISFRRNPLEPSPADELDMEPTNGRWAGSARNFLVMNDDRGTCTDQVILLMRQVQPCRFGGADKRGSASRGRARVIGFPGICCKHCNGHSSQGRYFPPSAKNLTDSTVNSMLTHVMSCIHCPFPVRASLAYLGHRAIQQKADLGGGWKKNFFQRVWDRLHVSMEWTAAEGNFGLPASHNKVSEYGEDDGPLDPHDDGGEAQGESGDQMNALIKAAAIWLTEQDGSKPRSKRINPGSPDSADDNEGSGNKRRRAV